MKRNYNFKSKRPLKSRGSDKYRRYKILNKYKRYRRRSR